MKFASYEVALSRPSLAALVPGQRRSSGPSRRPVVMTRRRLEPWRDWAVITVVNHALLLAVALLHPAWPVLVLCALPLGLGWAVGTLTVLHDAGHQMFGRRSWPNVLAVQTAVPAGLWAGHWGLKHRVHHKLTQVYPVDESTRSSSLVRLHPGAPLLPVHRRQHLYVWGLYGLAWLGELRSQLRYLVSGDVQGTVTPGARARTASFVTEKALWLLVLLPYGLVLGWAQLAVLVVLTETVASVAAAVVLVVGHINEGLEPATTAPAGREWAGYLVRTTANFSVDSVAVRFLTGGMTHHLAHHLRPVAVRSTLPELHRTLVQDLAEQVGEPVHDYPTLRAAVGGHFRRMRELGRPEQVPAPR